MIHLTDCCLAFFGLFLAVPEIHISYGWMWGRFLAIVVLYYKSGLAIVSVMHAKKSTALGFRKVGEVFF